MKAFRAAVKEELAAHEPSVIIAQRPCALLKTVSYGAPVEIDAARCKKCGSCMRLGCPAIYKEAEAYHIDHSLCVGCGLCKQMCAFGAIQKPGEEEQIGGTP